MYREYFRVYSTRISAKNIFERFSDKFTKTIFVL